MCPDGAAAVCGWHRDRGDVVSRFEWVDRRLLGGLVVAFAVAWLLIDVLGPG